MLRLLGFSLLLLLPVVDACAQPLRFVCEPPRGKRLEQTGMGMGKTTGEPVWADDVLENVRPAVTIDGETLTVTWGSTVSNQTKGATPKPTTYVFASAYRNDQSILATRVDRAGAEIFQFYFGSKTLLRLASISGDSSNAITAPAIAAIQTANCREQ
ncbi:hypothetical protein [Bradyrhizobium sp. OAE829]|uniref:hypothetical protein n=1 Tax=Bradyrhizobium sp. OAE829 TaxID=2663807 RepID=UPI00178A56BE